MPGQFIPLLEDLSNFQITARRFADPTFSKLLVIAGNDMRLIVAEQLACAGIEAEIALEPMRRDSAAAVAARAAVKRDLDFLRLDADAFAKAPKTSIDYALMERMARAGVPPVDLSWSDIDTPGRDLGRIGAGRRRQRAEGRGPGGRDPRSLVHSDGLLTIVVGLDGVVVATRDAVLVTSRERADAIKDLVGQLKAAKRPEAEDHLTMDRPRGSEQRTDIGLHFQVKRITVKPGHCPSLQKHFHRAEHWVVVRGTAEVTIDDRAIQRHEDGGA